MTAYTNILIADVRPQRLDALRDLLDHRNQEHRQTGGA